MVSEASQDHMHDTLPAPQDHFGLLPDPLSSNNTSALLSLAYSEAQQQNSEWVDFFTAEQQQQNLPHPDPLALMAAPSAPIVSAAESTIYTPQPQPYIASHLPETLTQHAHSLANSAFASRTARAHQVPPAFVQEEEPVLRPPLKLLEKSDPECWNREGEAACAKASDLLTVTSGPVFAPKEEGDWTRLNAPRFAAFSPFRHIGL